MSDDFGDGFREFLEVFEINYADKETMNYVAKQGGL
jgi:hypothetical protein